jgi:hypothetical protein
VLELATEAVKSNRVEADRLKTELADVEAQQARFVELLMDRSISDPAKQAINRQMTEAEKRRDDLLAALDGLRQDANDNTESLAAMVREVFDAAKENLQAATSPEGFNRFVEQFVGPMTTDTAGDVIKRKLPMAKAAGSNSDSKRLLGCIAGACSDPVHRLIGSRFRQRVLAA